MFRRSLFLLIFIFILSVAAEAKAPRLDIVVTPAANNSYSIKISFEGDANRSIGLRLPSEWGGQQELYKAVRGLTAINGASLKETDKPFLKTLNYDPQKKVTYTYNISQDFIEPLKNEIRYRPVTDPQYIHWIGNTIWVLPDWDDNTEVDVSIEWKGFAKEWTIANSFASGKHKQKFRAELQQLRSAVFVAGDYRLIETKASGNIVNLAIRGNWQFSDTELAAMTAKIIEVERDFFRDHSQKYYLVTLIPIDGGGPNSLSIGGTGLTDSFALFSTPNARLDQFKNLLAHEYAHNWIPGKLIQMPSENEQSFYWFSEGFTEFYTLRLLYRGGLMTQAEFIGRYNELIREYYMSPVKTASNERILKDFWTDMQVQRLPYLRGFLYATNLDAEIRRASKDTRSLDDVVREMLDSSKENAEEVTIRSLAAIFTKQLGSDAVPDIMRYLIEGNLIVPHGDALGNAVTQEMVEHPVFELGFDFDKFAKERIVANLDPKSSAYAAGLRNGQQRTDGFSLTFGETSKEVELKVKDETGEKVVRFFPVARERLKMPLYKLKLDQSNPH